MRPRVVMYSARVEMNVDLEIALFAVANDENLLGLGDAGGRRLG